MKYLILALLLFPVLVNADEPRIWLDINWFSFHEEDYYYTDQGVKQEFNENNPGILVRYELHQNLDIGAGMFKHSFDEWTPALGFEIHTRRNRGISIGAVAGYAPGYKDTDINTVFFILPMVQAQLPGSPTIGIRAGYMPFGNTKFGTVQITVGF